MFYTWAQRRLAPDGAMILHSRVNLRVYQKDDSAARCVPAGFKWQRIFDWFNFRDGPLPPRSIEIDLEPFSDDADWTCPTRLYNMSLQCEACGPDLVLYGRQSRNGGSVFVTKV